MAAGHGEPGRQATRRAGSGQPRQSRDNPKRRRAIGKKAGELITAERKRFYDVLEMLPVYVVLLSADYHVPFANRFFRERFGESGGRRCYEYLFHRTEPCENCETFKVLKTGAPHRWEWTGPDGRYYDIHDYPFTDSDGSSLIMEVGIDITERKQASEKRYRSFIEVTGVLGWTTGGQGEVIEDIPSFRNYTGQTYDEVKRWGWSKALHPDDLERTIMVWKRAVTEKSTYETEYRLRRADGVYRYFLARGTPVFREDGEIYEWVGTCIDITERRKAEDALRESQRDLSRAQEVANIGSWRLDVRKNELAWSDETCRMFGLPQGTPMTYETFLAAVHPEDKEYVNDKWRAALEGEDYDIEHRIIVGDKIKWVREKAELEFDKDGVLRGGFGTVQDITGRKQVEKMKDEFIGLVSHELRTPMTVISGSLRTAVSAGVSPEDSRALLQNAIEGADSLAAILENMLELSRHQVGRLQLSMEPVSVPEVAGRVIDKLKGQKTGHSFQVDIPGALPRVIADPIRLERILYNLLENATKFSPAYSAITISARRDGRSVVTAVTDRGRGIAEEAQERMFEPFRQFGDGVGRYGAGLGLVVCKRLVEAHGGWIKVDSAPGCGSTFSFALPVYMDGD